MSGRLHGLSVLVTRPREQSDALCALIERAGGRPVRFPAVEILPPTDPEAARALLAGAAGADLLIFVSANAVRHAFDLLPEILPETVQVAAVGRATARALEAVGLEPTLVPETRYDSEGLLALPALQQMAGRRVIIVRGEGGRELLRQELQARGAEVACAEVYRRRCTERSARNLVAGWPVLVQAAVVTSVELFDCLWERLGEEGQGLLRQTPLVVIGERIAGHARERGCTAVTVAAQASDHAILEALCALAEGR